MPRDITGVSVEPMLTVLHIGVVGRSIPGGMAQVVEEYRSWEYDRCVIEAIASTLGKSDTRKRDFKAVWKMLKCVLRLLKAALTSERIVVTFHVSQGGSFIREGSLVLLGRLLRLPAVVQIHGSSFPEYARSHRKIVQLVLNSARAVFVLTSEAESVASGLVERKQIRVVRIKNAVLDPVVQKNKNPIVLFGGEVGRRKGVDTLVDAWTRIAPGLEGWELIIAGPVAPDWICSGGNVTNMKFLGGIDRSDLLELEAESAIVVLPSREEALPVFLIESMARGCAVVASDVGHVAELVGDSGILISPGDPVELARALTLLIDDSEVRDVMAKRARTRYLEGFSSGSVAGALENEWLRIAEERYSDC
ncbi:MAG: glycosyltransferase [Alcaligenaceae bacterium]|nr:MAG: glycosyltransferase [Alcaligenaceae bacterium]